MSSPLPRPTVWSRPGAADPAADPVAVTAGETSTRLRSVRSRLPVAYPALLGVRTSS